MINELHQLQAAIITFTRLPLNSNKLESAHFQLAHYYLPAVGIIVGLITAALFEISTIYFSAFTSALLAILAGILITGAIHEDGFADCCDGFGAGHDAESIQAIMKDSQLGSYGVLGLIGIISVKVAFLNEIFAERQLLALVLMHVLARTTPLLIMATLPRAPCQASKMTATLAENQQLLLIMLLAITVGLFIAVPLPLFFSLIVAVTVTALCCKTWFEKRLNGYNGDCLGASEQLTECAILITFALYY